MKILCGVATLSCTDYSTYSGGSTGSSASDITDPGSPFSTASSHSEDSSAATSSQPTKMPPNTQHPTWPWSSTNANTSCSGTSSRGSTSTEINLSNDNDDNSSSPHLKRLNSIEDKTATINNNNNLNNNHTHSPSNNKRLRTEAANIATSTNSNTNTNDSVMMNAKTKTLPMCTNSSNNQNQNQIALPTQTVVSSVAVTKRPNLSKRLESTVSIVVGGKIQQGKITEYFKAQMKPNTASIKRELITGKNIDGTQNVHKYFTLVDGPKVILDSKSTKFQPYWNKLNVRALALANPSPVKKVILDTKTKKITHLISNVPRKILPAPARKVSSLKAAGDKNIQNIQQTLVSQPMVKLTALRYQQLQECPYMSLRPAKPPDGKKIPITNLNLTVSSTVVPIVKLNNMPSKLNGSNINNNTTNHLSVSVETAVPTVPTAKPKSPNNNNNHNNNNNSNHNNHNNNNIQTVLQKPTQPIIKKSLSVDSTCTDSSSTNSEFTTPISSAISVADSDSGFGSLLTISVASTPSSETEPQKSPILSQPKTIRFPAKRREDQRRQDNTDSGLCRWQECQAQFDTSGALLEHLQIKHVISQATQEHYVCLWVGCKVHGRTSCSRSWLERHVLGHAGNKPFRCIVDGCGGRFSSQQTLEKHVNSHFNSSESNSNGSTRKSLESGTTKLFKRNGKKLRYRRQPWSARMFDFFDAGIMEGLQHQLISMTEKRTAGDVCNKSSGDVVTLHSRILARRTEPNGERKVLLKWHPPNIIADEWVLESKSTQTKTVSIPTLEPSAIDSLGRTLFPPRKPQNTEALRTNRRKRNAKCS